MKENVFMSPKLLALKKRLIAHEKAKVAVCLMLAMLAVAGRAKDVFYMLWIVPASVAASLAIELISFRISGGWKKWFEEPAAK